MIDRLTCTPAQAAAELGKGWTIDRVYELCREAMTLELDDPRRFPARRVGSRWTISVRALTSWIENGPAVLAGPSIRNRGAA